MINSKITNSPPKVGTVKKFEHFCELEDYKDIDSRNCIDWGIEDK